MEIFSIICESLMVILFGLSWPFNIVRAYRAKTTKGSSLMFMLFILIGYISGILIKIFAWSLDKGNYWTPLRTFAFIFYCINAMMLIVSILVYFRNKKIDLTKENR